MPSHDGLTPEQIERMSRALERMFAPLFDLAEECKYVMPRLREASEEVAEQERQGLEERVASFASMLDNMTDAQIWREIKGSE